MGRKTGTNTAVNPLARTVASVLCACALTTQVCASDQGGGRPVPDFSSADFPWVPAHAGYLPPESGPGPVMIDEANLVTVRQANTRGEIEERQLRLADLTNPNLKPWVVDHLKKANDDLLSGKERYSSRASCAPGGVPNFLIYAGAFQPLYVIQAPGKVVLINQGNVEVRHIALNVPHRTDPRPSWYGDSVGYYEGGELVVDTIGFNGKTFVDEDFNVPHTDQLHVVERFKLIENGTMLEVRFRVEDPGAFNAPWSGIVRYRHTNREDRLEEQPCAEQNTIGVGFLDRYYEVPSAAAPDF